MGAVGSNERPEMPKGANGPAGPRQTTMDTSDWLGLVKNELLAVRAENVGLRRRIQELESAADVWVTWAEY